MSVEFLTNFMRFVQEQTHAERLMVLDLDLNIHDRVNVDDTLLNKEDFSDLLHSAVDEAITTDDIVITNNLITDPEDAPKTNLHLHELRMVIAIPIRGHGAVYLDQRIRQGIFPRDLVEKINEFARYIVENNKIDLSVAEFVDLYSD
ncbi:MAG: hypothetical protein WBC91_09850 [Phototrophicaceae bacterium]|mgnify:CR=1 FL=1